MDPPEESGDDDWLQVPSNPEPDFDPVLADPSFWKTDAGETLRRPRFSTWSTTTRQNETSRGSYFTIVGVGKATYEDAETALHCKSKALTTAVSANHEDLGFKGISYANEFDKLGYNWRSLQSRRMNQHFTRTNKPLESTALKSTSAAFTRNLLETECPIGGQADLDWKTVELGFSRSLFAYNDESFATPHIYVFINKSLRPLSEWTINPCVTHKFENDSVKGDYFSLRLSLFPADTVVFPAGDEIFVYNRAKDMGKNTFADENTFWVEEHTTPGAQRFWLHLNMSTRERNNATYDGEATRATSA